MTYIDVGCFRPAKNELYSKLLVFWVWQKTARSSIALAGGCMHLFAALSFQIFLGHFRLVTINSWFFYSASYILSFNIIYGLIKAGILILFPKNYNWLLVGITLGRNQFLSTLITLILKVYSPFISMYVILHYLYKHYLSYTIEFYTVLLFLNCFV